MKNIIFPVTIISVFILNLANVNALTTEEKNLLNEYSK